jgi:hypothetical protein
MKIKQYYVLAIILPLFFGSELSAQQTGNHAKLGGRAVRSHRTPGLSSVRRTKLNNQVINGVLKQKSPAKSVQRQLKAIEWRLRLRAPATVGIKDGKRNVYGWGTINGRWWFGQNYMVIHYSGNWFPR